MAHVHSPEPSGHAAVGHEERDVAYRPVVIGLVGLIALLLASAGLMYVLLVYFVSTTPPQPANPLAQNLGRQVPPAPRLQSNPLQDLAQMRAEEDAVLNSYGWVDRNAGIVRVPIERAMELLVQSGPPSRTQGEGQP